jgi:dUTP pyrophosphatase
MRIKLDAGCYLPERAHDLDAGYDLRSPISIRVPAHGSAIIDTGVHMEIPQGYDGELISKSGLNVKHNITSTGLIDAGYTGSIAVKLYNHGDVDYMVESGDKISQIVIRQNFTPELELVVFLGKTERGDNGFGSTGR